MRQVDAYRYDLPEEAIAKTPAEPADSARLLVLEGDALRHCTFVDFPSLLVPGDVLVLNETLVIRARLRGTRENGGGAVEILLLRPAAGGPVDFTARDWHVLAKPGRRLSRGARVRFGDSGAAEIIDVRADGSRIARFDVRVPFEHFLQRHGEMPLPPYVGSGNEERAQRYQTIFARVPGSVAAPTASLHFTPRVLDAVRARGVTIVPLVLDVGLGTFRPMEGETIDEHVMHAERYSIPQDTADAVNAAKRTNRRIVAAGTTVLRALEASAVSHDGAVCAGEADTALFVTPGFPFRIVDALLTNFHLPASTLLVLVCAFAGYERTVRAYGTARAARYRFYSFGDAMFCLRATAPLS